MPRLFIALRPPPAIRQRLLALGAGIPGARWQDDEQLHVTLRFIGDIDRPFAEDVAAALGSVHACAPSVSIAGVGRFEHRGRTEAVWAGIAPVDALRHLQRKVEQICVRAGLAPERRVFLPHVTLARFSRSAGFAPEIAGWLAAHAGLTLPAFHPSHIVLFESHLDSAGASYAPVARWPLEAA